MFRDKPLQLSGWAGREYALKTDGNIANAFGFPTYDFSWDGLGEINNSRNPHIFISLLVDGSQNRNKRDLQTVSTYPEFADKQGALAFWDKILSSVRTFSWKLILCLIKLFIQQKRRKLVRWLMFRWLNRKNTKEKVIPVKKTAVIPVVFITGILGTNICDNSGKVVWGRSCNGIWSLVGMDY